MYHSIKKIYKLKNVVILLLIETYATVEIGSLSKSHICFVISISNSWNSSKEDLQKDVFTTGKISA